MKGQPKPTVEVQEYICDVKYIDGIIAKKSLTQELIRCKNCKYAHITYDGDIKYCDIWFPDEAEYLDGNYYCASAEREEE